MIERLSVRGRLLLAFFGISSFTVLAALAAVYSFRQVSDVLERITEARVPSAVASLELSRQAERIVAAAPTLLAANSVNQYTQASAMISAEARRLTQAFEKVEGSTVDSQTLRVIDEAVRELLRNLDALDLLVSKRLAVVERKEALRESLSATTITAQRLVAPGVLVLDTNIAAWRRAKRGVSAEGTNLSNVAQTIVANVPMQKARNSRSRRLTGC